MVQKSGYSNQLSSVVFPSFLKNQGFLETNPFGRVVSAGNFSFRIGTRYPVSKRMISSPTLPSPSLKSPALASNCSAVEVGFFVAIFPYEELGDLLESFLGGPLLNGRISTFKLCPSRWVILLIFVGVYRPKTSVGEYQCYLKVFCFYFSYFWIN